MVVMREASAKSSPILSQNIEGKRKRRPEKESVLLVKQSLIVKKSVKYQGKLQRNGQVKLNRLMSLLC